MLTGAADIAYVHRSLDEHIRSPWRQADYTAIARNFYREGMNPLYPRIDWRGAGPGYVEAEFPLLPWLGAVLFEQFGYREWLLRVPSVVLAITSLLVFARLAASLLGPGETVFATAAFGANPILFHLATAMQPEPLMLFCALVAVVLCWRWEEEPGRSALLLGSAAAAAGAMLGKAPAAYLGFVLGYTVLRCLRRRALRSPVVWAAAALALGPPLAWYAWAHHFWTAFGNSLGVTNADHWTTLERLVPPRFLIGVLKWETLGVFTPLGWVLVLAALLRGGPELRRPLVWYLAVWAFYLVAGNASSGDSNYYYHGIAVAPGCLLMGLGVAAVRQRAMFRPGMANALAAATLASLLALTAFYVHLRDGRSDLAAMRTCSQRFASLVPEKQLIVVGGGPKYDSPGRIGAYNLSMPFAWMDRKGFNYGSDELGVETLDRIAAAGGRFWMATRDELDRTGMQPIANARYRLVADCESRYFLYDLRGASHSPG